MKAVIYSRVSTICQDTANQTEALAQNTDLIWDNFLKQLDALKKYELLGFDFTTNEAQKKEILNLLLYSFILYPSGKIELRFKIPANEEQIADKTCTLSHHVNAKIRV